MILTVIIASMDTFMTRIVKENPDETKKKVVIEPTDKMDGIMKKFLVRPVIYEHKMKNMLSKGLYQRIL